MNIFLGGPVVAEALEGAAVEMARVDEPHARGKKVHGWRWAIAGWRAKGGRDGEWRRRELRGRSLALECHFCMVVEVCVACLMCCVESDGASLAQRRVTIEYRNRF